MGGEDMALLNDKKPESLYVKSWGGGKIVLILLS